MWGAVSSLALEHVGKKCLRMQRNIEVGPGENCQCVLPDTRVSGSRENGRPQTRCMQHRVLMHNRAALSTEPARSTGAVQGAAAVLLGMSGVAL